MRQRWHGRNGVGIELEFPEISKKNVEYQFERNNGPKPTGEYKFIHGNAKELKTLLPGVGIKHEQLSLVINGTLVFNNRAQGIVEYTLVTADTVENNTGFATNDYVVFPLKHQSFR